MSFFTKKKEEDFFFLQNEEEISEGLPPETGEARTVPAHALTPEEVSFGSSAGSSISDSSAALDSLKKRMQQLAQQGTGNDIPAPPPKPAEAAPAVMDDADPRSTADEVLSTLDTLLEKAETAAIKESPVKSKPADTGKTGESLLEKCRPYILDEDGNDATLNAEPSYRLESVAEILNAQSKQTLHRLSEKYEVSFDDLGKYAEAAASDGTPAPEEKPEPEPQIFEDILSGRHPDAQTAPHASRLISDLDSPSFELTGSGAPDIDSTATIKFTPITDDAHSKTRISVSSQTRSIDLTGEMTQLSSEDKDLKEELRLEQNEFEEFVPETEFTSAEDARRLIRLLSLRKRNSFLTASLSVLLTLALCLFKLPALSGLLLSHTRICLMIGTGISLATVLLNLTMFRSLSKLFRRHSTADVSACLASVAVLLYAVLGIIKNEPTTDLLLLLGLILSVRALGRYWRDAYLLSNIRQITGSRPKHAIKLIGDSAVTFAMAKNAVEGDTLIAAPQSTDQIGDYMKYSTYGVFLSGKLPFITAVFLLLSVIAGFASASYYNGMLYGFYAAAVMQCFSALPVFFLIDNLPLYAAANKLNRLGAMIAGKTGAEQLEMANAVVMSADDLFPKGTVTLHQMNILSQNSVDDTIMRAASLTEAMGSTLAPLFKKIAGTASSSPLPESDTVKYEERMGISGWVDNKLLFIGNRTLMEAHGISVPEVELDRKILRNGFFPVYVASEDKAVALLAVRYTVKPEIGRELRKLSALGVTVLVNSTDPNLTEEMICDYMELYDDSVRVMNTTGCHMYKSVASHIRHCSAPAAYRDNPLGLPATLNCAGKIRKSNAILTVLAVIAALLGAVLFAYASFDGSGSLTGGLTVLLYSLSCTVLSVLLYLIERP